MAERFFRKKSKGEVERDPGWDEYFTSNRSTDNSPMRGKLHHSVPVNPLLAQAMYLRGYIEKVGSGTRDMVTKSRAWGNEAPVWEIEDGDDFRVVLKRPDIGGVRAASATTSYTTRKTTRYTGSIAPLRSDLEAVCEGLTGNARKILQVISEDPGVTIESLATLVKLTPDGVRYHLKALAKSVGLHHSSDRKGGEWEVTGPKKRAQEAGPRNGDSRHPVEEACQGGLVKGPSQRGLVKGPSQILLLLLEMTMLSTSEVACAFGKSRASGRMKRNLLALIEDGLIEGTVPQKRGARLQKYRLTAKGRKLAATLAKNTAKPKGKRIAK